METLVEKWEITELLAGCKDESEKIQLSSALNEMLENISNRYTDESDENQIKAGILIPLVARIFYKGIHNIKIDKVISIVDELFPKLKELFESNVTGLDAEAEFCDICKEKYIKLEN